MLKITIEVKENKNKDSCTVKMINPKDLSKATSLEKKATAIVSYQIEKSLKELED